MPRQVLESVLPEAAQRQRFSELQAECRDDWGRFWPAVEQALGAGSAAQLQLMSQLFFLTVGNQPLVAALTAAEAGHALTSALDLAARGYYDPAKWESLIGGSIPPGFPGSDPDAQAGSYAQHLAAQVSVVFPTAVLADRIRRNILPIAGNAAIAIGVADFLTSNQGQFEIGVEGVDAYIARTGLAGTPAEVKAQATQLQQLYLLTPDDASLAVLLRHNLSSAHAIIRYAPTEFVRTFADELGGAGPATATHTWAAQIFALSRLPRPSRALFQQARR